MTELGIANGEPVTKGHWKHHMSLASHRLVHKHKAAMLAALATEHEAAKRA